MSKIMTAKTEEDCVLIFVKDAGDIGRVCAYIGQAECEDITYETIREAGIPIHTLILIDNSISIPEESRQEITDILKELLAVEDESEFFSIGTISETVHMLCEESSDRVQLEQVLDELTYADQETYLTDALYDYLISRDKINSSNVFERILLISDGMDNKEIGYTSKELSDLLEISPIPIYSIGVYNRRKDNAENLERMFSVSRGTQASAYLLGDLDTEQFGNDMAQEWEDVVFRIPVPEKACDGSRQTLTIQLEREAGEETLSVDQLRMPLLAEQKEEVISEKEVILEPEPAVEVAEPATEEYMAGESSASGMSWTVSLAGIGFLIFILLLVVLLKKRKKKKCAVMAEDAAEAAAADETVYMDAGMGATEYYIPGAVQDNGETVLIGNGRTVRIMLTDIHYPERVYQRIVGQSLFIGSSQDMDICIDYDRTVSRKQCEIVRSEEGIYIRNHSNSNITLLNGQALTVECWIDSGCVISMGRVEMRIDIWEE